MSTLLSKIAVVSVVVLGILYQFMFKQLIFGILGVGRDIKSITAFPHVHCEKVIEPSLEACEDMWLHEPTGYLYMACSDVNSRTKWLPAVDYLNASARGMNDRLVVLDTRGSGSIGSRLKWISVENFSGIKGDGTFNLHGMDIRVDPESSKLHILLINHRPPISPNGDLLDAFKVGANSTVEEFITIAGSDTIRHVKTFADPLIATPNRIQWVTADSFVITNDNGDWKTGFRRGLKPLFGGGNVVYCSRTSCNIGYSKFWGPNGLVRGQDGLIYVPNTLGLTIDVFTMTDNHLLELFHKIKVPFPIDNLSVDRDGNIFAAAISAVLKWVQSSKRPYDMNPPSTVLKIRRESKGEKGGIVERLESDNKGYSVETVMEDNGTVLPGSTIAIHDAKTGRFFLGGVMSPFITICETKRE